MKLSKLHTLICKVTGCTVVKTSEVNLLARLHKKPTTITHSVTERHIVFTTSVHGLTNDEIGTSEVSRQAKLEKQHAAC